MRRRTKIHLAVNLLLLLLAAAGLLIIFFPTLASSLPFTASFTANSGDSTLEVASESGASAQPTTAPSATTSLCLHLNHHQCRLQRRKQPLPHPALLRAIRKRYGSQLAIL